MRAIANEPELTTTPGTAVAVYRDLRGAALAVGHLRSRGWSDDALNVRPDGLRPEPAAFESVPDDVRHVRAALTGGVAGGAVVMIGGVGLASVMLALVAVVGAAGLACALDAVVLRHRRARVRAAASAVKVERFAVVCSNDAEAANHELARWWDPDARPAPAPAA